MTEPPENPHPNCRCTLIITIGDWRIEIEDTLERIIGRTNPTLASLLREIMT